MEGLVTKNKYSVPGLFLFFTITCAVIFVLVFTSCNNSGKKVKVYTVGFSQCTFGDNWRKTMQKEMERELLYHPEINFIIKGADLNSQKQIEQIQELIDAKVDLLIVSPNEAEPITPIVDKAYKMGIPLVILDRSTLSKNYTAFIGGNNYKVGLDAGAYAYALLRGKGNVLEISEFQVGSSADIGRRNGFTDVIKKYPDIKYVSMFTGDLEKSPAEWDEKFTDLLTSLNNIQLIFAHNDRLALAAYKVCSKLGLDKKIKIIGVDGLSGENAGIDLVEKGKLKATILYPTGGKEAIQTAVDILEGKPYKKENELAVTIIDSTNVRVMRLQDEKLSALQIDIERGQQKIKEQEIITNNQSTIIYTISISLALALILGFVLFYYLRENRKINARLALQNEEISSQRNQLIELGKQAKEATEAKINFFTNISHEFKTPLTLILGPMDELLTNNRMHFKDKQYLTLIQKNVIRLLRLVNQLIDFRKIESDKMNIAASENDLVQFTNEITEAFKELARKRNIDLRVFCKERSINLWFDVSMLDKVLFNLLSNAMKFTNDYGFIHITLEKNTKENIAIIKVEDNGIGMSVDVANHAFELFYQANITNQQGSGLGLSLSKELINLHHGTITVSSKQGKGTSFEIRLLLGTSHLEKEEMVKEKPAEDNRYFDQKIYSTEIEKITLTHENNTEGLNVSERSLLIIEDNPDLRNFLSEIFQNEYSIFMADNGVTGLREAFDNIPDIIISDVVLPGKDGFSIANILKNDIRTSHIPIILLTAKTEIQQQIEGMKSMADAYITKPFNVQFLKETLQSIMKNRGILREHYISEINADVVSQNPKKLDRRFINEFTSTVETNYSNEAFSIDDLCRQMNISRVQLYRKVKALLDCNVNDYILNVRLQKSKYLLNQGEFTIAEIAFRVGFASPAYFSTVFKSKFGITPTNYKEKKVKK